MAAWKDGTSWKIATASILLRFLFVSDMIGPPIQSIRDKLTFVVNGAARATRRPAR